MPTPQQGFAGAEVEPALAHILAQIGGLSNHDVVAIKRGILLNHDRIGTVGQNPTGKDSHGLTRADGFGERPSRWRITDNSEFSSRSGTRRADSISVHSR